MDKNQLFVSTIVVFMLAFAYITIIETKDKSGHIILNSKLPPPPSNAACIMIYINTPYKPCYTKYNVSIYQGNWFTYMDYTMSNYTCIYNRYGTFNIRVYEN